MNIDKFGHHVHKRLRTSDYIDIVHNTLQKSVTGDYDLKLAKLRGLTSPKKEDEAVNKAYVDNEILNLRNEINKVHINVKTYLLQLENLTNKQLSALSSVFYSKTEIDNLIRVKTSNHE